MSIPLLPNQLSNALLQVRLALGADLSADPATWAYTDITIDVMQANGGGVTIAPMGRSNEVTTAQPAGCSMRLKNQGGAYTPYNPVSSNYPNIRLGTPVQVRVSLDGGSNWSIRFQGEASAWTPGWDAQGKSAYVVLTASGVTRRLGSGSKPLRSALYRTIVGITPGGYVPAAYWPIEDAAGATGLSSAIPGVPPLQAPAGISFAADSGPAGSGSLATLSGSDLPFPISVPSGATSMAVQWVMKVPAGLSVETTLAEFYGSGGALVRWQVTIIPTGILAGFWIYGYDSSGAQVAATGIPFGAPNPAISDFVDHYVLFNFSPEQVSLPGFVTSTLYVMLDGINTYGGGPVTAGSLGNVTSGKLFAANGTSVGHVAVYTDPAFVANLLTSSLQHVAKGLLGYAGEDAIDRLVRLCGEEGIALTVVT